MKNLLVRFTQEEQGQDLVEYSLLLGVRCAGFSSSVDRRGAVHCLDLERC